MKNFGIWKVDEQTKQRMRLLAVGKGMSMAELLKELVDFAWRQNRTLIDRSIKKKIRRIIKRNRTPI